MRVRVGCETVRDELMTDSVIRSDPAKRHAATCSECGDLVASFTYIDRVLQGDVRWVPPAEFGQRLAASLPQYESIERFKLRIPALPPGAVAGLVVAISGAALDSGPAGLLPLTALAIVAIALVARAWLVVDGLAGRARGGFV